jgi:hypothetical protein
LSWLGAITSASLLLIACGGDGGITAGVGSGGTGSAVSGPVTGFGSVFVNGVRFDDSAASVSIDDAPGVRDSLRLGMMVEIDSSSDLSLATGIANSITSFSYAKGPISGKTVDTLTVLGLTITVTPGTAFEGVSGLAALRAGDVVEVHGIPDGLDGLKATYIKKQDSNDKDVRLVGLVKDWRSTDRTFTLYGTRIQYPSGMQLPNGMDNNVVVRVKGVSQPASVPLAIDASNIRAVTTSSVSKEGWHVEVYGIVTELDSSNFKIDGLKIDASSAQLEQVTLANGARVEAEGTIVNGILRASKVKSEDDSRGVEVELHGSISDVDPDAKTFLLRNVLVTWNTNTAFDQPFGADDLKDGANVEVKASNDNGSVLATSIKKED